MHKKKFDVKVEQDFLVNAKITANSKEFEVKFDQEKNLLKIKLKSKAQKGQANKELQKKLKEFFETDIQIVSGEKSRQKKLLVKKNEKTKKFFLLKP